MVSSPDGQEPHASGQSTHSILAYFQGDLAERIDFQQMFVLIDGVLPFEACLYYQVLPLYLEGSRLILGMVSPEDRSASDYVRRIISYHHYMVLPRQISSEALQASLTAYLNYAGQREKVEPRPRSESRTARSRSAQPVDHNLQPTLVVDSPDDLVDERQQEPPPQEVPPEDPAKPDKRPSVEEIPNQEITFASAPLTEIVEPPPEEPVSSESGIAGMAEPIPVLKLNFNYLSSPIEVLGSLPPRELLQELLGRVLVGGIGRLYLERQEHYGRVLWSQNGVLKSVLDPVDLDKFRGLLSELKRFADVSLVPLKKPRQMDLERIFNGSRLLMRCRFMPSTHGEEATVQVLRGAALRFYQQQQLALLERDALGIARQLQNKLNELRDRARVESSMSGARLEVIPALAQMLKTIEEQILSLQDDEPSAPPSSSDDGTPIED